MFNHIGKKIKIVALVFFWLDVIVLAAYGFYVAYMGRVYLNWTAVKAILHFWGYLMIGIITAWLGSILLYGFGELVDSNQSIAADTKKIRSVLTHHEPADNNQ